MRRLLAWLDGIVTRRLDRVLTAAGFLPNRKPPAVDALSEWRNTRAVNPRPVPCIRCKCMTWDGLHRDGSPDCDAWEAGGVLVAAAASVAFFLLLLLCLAHAINHSHTRQCAASSPARQQWLGCPTSAGAALDGEEETAPATAPTVSHPDRIAPRSTPSAVSRSRPFTGLTASAPGHLNWRALRDCESSNNYTDRDSATYRGAYQFDRETWASVGGTGDPADASPAEQDMRAQRLYAARGRSPWPNCGRYL